MKALVSKKPGCPASRADRGEEPHKTLAGAQQPASGGEAELTCRPAAGRAKPATSPSFPVVRPGPVPARQLGLHPRASGSQRAT
ncbi:unnamed protein product [Arctogadus glacialis]